MITARFNTDKFMKVLNNTIEYNSGFLQETKSSKKKIEKMMADISISAFYQYLDGLARLHPGMLHHVYEWGQVGNPSARLFDLKLQSFDQGAQISANFLESRTIPENGSEPFYDKAEIMEKGIPVVIKEKNAQALFFEVDGEEFFRVGPIVIENPGGAAARGSFVKAFEEFYNTYFTQVYLRSIKFYEHFKNPQPYRRNIKNSTRSANARSLGKKVALEWILKTPGSDDIDN
jgi:hypothetical protein